MSRSPHDSEWPGMDYTGNLEEFAANLFMDRLMRKMEEAARLGVPFPQVYFPRSACDFPRKN